MVNPAGDVAEIGIIPNQGVLGKSFIVWSCVPRRKAAGFLFARTSFVLAFAIRGLACFVMWQQSKIIWPQNAAFERFANYAKSR